MKLFATAIPAFQGSLFRPSPKAIFSAAALALAVFSAAPGFTAEPARTETAQEATVRKLIQPQLGNEAPAIDSVTKTPYSGLYEIRIGSDIFYTDEKGRYLFIGRILDTKTMEDHTRARIDELTKVQFSDLPLDLALKTVKGNGKRTIAVFEDPNCGYCKRFRKTLQEMDDITIYTFMYNILSPDSTVKSKNVWCSADRNKAWDDWMLKGKTPPTAPESCTATPNDKVFALGQKLKITGTPTVFFTDGTRVPGAIDAKALEAKLSSIK